MTAAAPARKKHAGESRIPELDGFRAIAALAVLITHALYGFPGVDHALDFLPRVIRGVLDKGWLGVDLFFVLSGLLISGILIDSRDKPNYFRNFYVRRVLRIMPLYFVSLAVMWYFYDAKYTNFFLCTLFFLANFASVFGFPVPHGPGVFWSLAVEEHFYLIWPLGAKILNRRSLAIAAFAIWASSPVLRGIAMAQRWYIPEQIYEMSFFRFDGLALGALLAIWTRSKWHNKENSLKLAAGMVGLSVLITVLGIPFGILGTKTVASLALRFTEVQLVFAAAILASLAMRGSSVTSILRSKFLGITSDFSYCIYVVHLSIGDGYLALLKRAGIDEVGRFGLQGAVAIRFVVICTATYIVAALSKRFLEDPFLRLKRHFV